jgi:hypothetical protein
MSSAKKKTAKKKVGKQVITQKNQIGSACKTLSHYQKIKQAVELSNDGKTGRQIAEVMQCHPSTVTRYLQHATKLKAEEISELMDYETAFQINTTGDLINTLQQHLLYEDSNKNMRVDAAAAGQLLSALNRRAKIFGLDKQAEEQESRNGDGDTYNIVMARFEEAVERGAMTRDEIPVLNK